MTQFVAILIDSVREAFARRALHIMTLIMLAVVALVLGIQIESRNPVQILRENTENLNVMSKRGQLLSSFTSSMDLELTIADIKPVSAQHRLGPEFKDGHIVTVDFHDFSALAALATSWYSFQNWVETDEWNRDRVTRVTDSDGVYDFLEDRFRHFGYSAVRVMEIEPPRFPQGLSANIAVAAKNRAKLERAHELSLFNRFDVPWTGNLVVFQTLIQNAFASTFAGFFGILVMVSLFAGFIPNLLQKGTLDLVLARPLGRSQLLLYKYLSSVLIVAAVNFLYFLCGATGLSRLTGEISGRFLACSLTLTAVFLVLYAVAVLTSILTRSESASALVALAVWGAASLMKRMKETGESLFQKYPAAETVVDVGYAILPKTADLATLNDWFLSGESMDTGSWSWSMIFGSTALFAFLCFGLACFFFRRHDC